MYKGSGLLFLFILSCFSSFSQVQSPDQFLGYKLGSRYTPHWRIVEYYKQVAAALPGVVKLHQYGTTNEGRPLIVVFISTASNIANLEAVRTNNLRLAGEEEGKGSAADAPAIVWLSYNVHGNETSSSEAGMKTVHALVDPANAETKAWLQNTVVIIDPCLNPDGRDRYVNWFTSVSGKTYNPSLNAREHREPWPGGRTNHYNFDLNRDWAWQTQVESQQRLTLYNGWLPQIHVDFHEQGVNQPYYFAPAAQPYHEVITKWQREFQNTIGRNHARLFDERGWLYFTRERFDLLYPSYGDTYPIYNGSIGMTYEQGGGPAGGSGVLTDEGDTLTLEDRVNHHYTTGLSTVETASKNRASLVKEFQNFYTTNVTTGVGDYKSYLIKYATGDAERINSLLTLLKKNGVDYRAAKEGTVRGFNYNSGKEESVTVTAADVVIPSAQPKSALVKVLFEPNTTVVDSVTYDITAWALPYVYGIKAYATRAAVGVSNGEITAEKINNPVTAPYGYVIRWKGVQSVKMAAALIQKGIKLRYAEQPFEVGTQSFERGSVIVLKTSNQYVSNLWEVVRQVANENAIQLTPVTTGFVEKGADFGSGRVRSIKKRSVALLTGEGINSNAAGEVWHFFEQVIHYPVTLINMADFSRVNWKDYDVVIMPDGNYRFLNEKPSADAFRAWVTGGGNVVALEGAVAQLAKGDWSIKLKKTDEDKETKNTYEPIRSFENRERDFIPTITPGSIFRVELDNTHPLAFGYPNYYYTLKQDDAIYEFIKEGGWNVGVLKKGKQVAGFVGSKLVNRLQDGLLFGTQEVGSGTVTYLADNVLFRSFWENGKLMFSNAVFLVGQ